MDGESLAGCDLRGLNLLNADFNGHDLRGTDLRKAYLRGADLKGALIDETTRADPSLRVLWELANHGGAGRNLRGADLNGAFLPAVDLRGADLRGAHLNGSYLDRADLSDANLSGAGLTGAHLREVLLPRARLREAVLISADLTGADLSGAELTGAGLRGAAMTRASLRGANLQYADLENAELGLAVLQGCDLCEANLSHAHLRDADFEGVRFSGGTRWPGLFRPDGVVRVPDPPEMRGLSLAVPAEALSRGLSRVAEPAPPARHRPRRSGPTRHSTRASVYLSGVPEAACGIGWDMALRALHGALEYVTGLHLDYDELLVLSGDAFAAVASDKYQDATYLASCTDPLTPVAAAFGFRGRWCFPDSYAEARDLVMQEIGAGRPVLAGGAANPYGCPPWGLITGYDRKRPWFCFAGYGTRAETRWMPVRGETGEPDTGPWNGRVRGLLASTHRFWHDRPMFVLGPRGLPPERREVITDALRRAPEVLAGTSVSIGDWGGVTYHTGREALAFLAEDLPRIDWPAVRDAPKPADAHGWWERPGVVAACADMVWRGRSAAARTFRQWSAEQPWLAAMVPTLEAAAALAQPVYDALTPRWPWEAAPSVCDNPAWRQDAARRFAEIDKLDAGLFSAQSPA
ncbi:MAG: pentapeptide repeat-containing protein [Armatimonadetes bacterium]|nr:pentapeptide repeat-containing protein [Armatimonadota bacterium]